MCEVESLQMQLRDAGRPVAEKIEQFFMNSLASISLQERIRRWKVRRDHLQKLLGPPRPTSGGPAVLPAVARTRPDLENPEKAAIGVDDRHPPPPGAGVNRRRRGSAQMDSPPPAAKRARGTPMFPYTVREDGKPPAMTLLHVQFAQMSVALLRDDPTLGAKANDSPFSRDAKCPIRGQKSSGRADHFFCNGYFRIHELRDIAAGRLPLPVPIEGVQRFRESEELHPCGSFQRTPPGNNTGRVEGSCPNALQTQEAAQTAGIATAGAATPPGGGGGGGLRSASQSVLPAHLSVQMRKLCGWMRLPTQSCQRS